MVQDVKSTVIQDSRKITFQFEFDIQALIELDLSENEMVIIKETIENNDSLKIIRTLASIVEKLERKTKEP